MLTKDVDPKSFGKGKCPFSSGKLSSFFNQVMSKALHTGEGQPAVAASKPVDKEHILDPPHLAKKANCPFSGDEHITLLGGNADKVLKTSHIKDQQYEERNVTGDKDQVSKDSETSSKCPFSGGSVPREVAKIVNKAIYTASTYPQDQTSSIYEKSSNELPNRDETPCGPVGPVGSLRAAVDEMLEESTEVRQTSTSTDLENFIATEMKDGTVFEYEKFFEGKIQQKKDDHSYRYFRKVNRQASTFPMGADHTYPGKPSDITVWCSNDYLGMSRHESVITAAKNVIDENGVGAGGTRNISGTSLYHGMLEDSLAEWHQKEAGLLFTSCYVANDTALYTLGQMLPDCIIFSDAGNHASMIHGIRTSGAKKKIFRHNDPAHLEELLAKADPSVPKVVAFETVHSMSGAVCPLEELCDVAHKYGALTFVDEVHAVGLYGKHGAGIGERDGCLHKMDIISGTLGKAVGCIGGYLVGSNSLIDTLRSYGSGFIFTTALPPDKVYAALTSLDVLKSEEGEELRKKHQSNAKKLRTKLVKQGFPVEFSPSHIVPVMTGDPEKCTQVSTYLQQEHGIYIQAINYPTVPRGQEKLRIAPTPFHTEEMMDTLVDALKQAWVLHKLSLLRPVCEVNCGCQYICHHYDGYLSSDVHRLIVVQ